MNVADVIRVDKLLHKQEIMFGVEAGSVGVEKCPSMSLRANPRHRCPPQYRQEKFINHGVLYKVKRRIKKAKSQVRTRNTIDLSF